MIVNIHFPSLVVGATLSCLLLIAMGMRPLPTATPIETTVGTPASLVTSALGVGSSPEELAACLLKSLSLQHSEACWIAVKEANAAEAIRIAKTQIGTKSMNAYSMHGMLLQTRECDAHVMRRVGVGSPGQPINGDRSSSEKWVCGDNLTPQSIVVSLGGGADFGFEFNIRQLLPQSRVVRVDCGGMWTVPFAEVQSWCIGERDETISSKTYKSFDSIMTSLRVSAIDLLKISIQGGTELQFFQLLERAAGRPKQILLTIHLGSDYPAQDPVAVLAFRSSLHTMGYSIALKERLTTMPGSFDYVLLHKTVV